MITGTTRHRRRSDDERDRIVAESFRPGASRHARDLYLRLCAGQRKAIVYRSWRVATTIIGQREDLKLVAYSGNQRGRVVDFASECRLRPMLFSVFIRS
ncbi:MAG: hypothetical protein P4N59_23520, partial [Negativicutes bacterium]|nr:hypothetical protein [Negativicutes bacterium]